MNRRNTLKVIGGAPIFAALSQGAGCAQTDFGAIARAPWSGPSTSEVDPRRRALSYAILAPNPHNMQPWLVKLVAENTINVQIDPTRLLPATDPYGRQILLGCGAFLELMTIGASQDGLRVDIDYWPDGLPGKKLDGRVFARATLVRDETIKPDPLFGQILRRRTNRNAHDPKRPVPREALTSLVGGVKNPLIRGAFADDADRQKWRNLVWRAMKLELETPATNLESIEVMRFGIAQSAQSPWGVLLDFPGVSALNGLGIMTRKTLLDSNSWAFKEGLKTLQAKSISETSFIWLMSKDNSRVTQLEAGRAYARMNLQATALGLAMQPWSQALQEFPEMSPLYAQAQSMTASRPDAPLQMLAAIGYAADAAAAPRRPLKDLITG